MLPKKIFFTGAPGSKWSGIAQILESDSTFNTTDRTPDREYSHHRYAGHKGAYFGSGMEFPPQLSIVHEAYEDPTAGTMLAKSHEWLFQLPGYLEDHCYREQAWIMMVYRPNDLCNEWWHEAGGFTITYPSYQAYYNNNGIQTGIREVNEAMLEFACHHQLSWDYFTSFWVEKNLGIEVSLPKVHKDVLVTLYKPDALA